MKLEESPLILQNFVGWVAIVLGVILVIASYVIKEPDRTLNHPILGEISVRAAFIIVGCIMTFFGGLLSY